MDLPDWTGEISMKSLPEYLDSFLLIILGGIPWQPYYQRALSMKTSQQVYVLQHSKTLAYTFKYL